MDAERLSAITWDVQEQKAWLRAYMDARRISAVRDAAWHRSAVQVRRDFAQATGRRIEEVPFYAERFAALSGQGDYCGECGQIGCQCSVWEG